MNNLTFIAPFFIVSSLQQSVSFYVEKLGFSLRYQAPEEQPFFAMVDRDQVTIMLKEIAIDVPPVPNHSRHRWAKWDAFIGTAEPDNLFEEFRSAGLTFRQPLQDDGDGLRGFEISDADGYVLFFGRPAS